MNAFTLAWLGWALAFAVIEGMALINSRTGDTLSEHIWAFIGSAHLTGKTPSGWTRIRRVITLSFLAWLVIHLLTGGWV